MSFDELIIEIMDNEYYINTNLKPSLGFLGKNYDEENFYIFIIYFFLHIKLQVKKSIK